MASSSFERDFYASDCLFQSFVAALISAWMDNIPEFGNLPKKVTLIIKIRTKQKNEKKRNNEIIKIWVVESSELRPVLCLKRTPWDCLLLF